MTVAECEKELVSLLIKAGAESPGLCASMILEHVTGLSRLALALDKEKELSASDYDKIKALAARRARHEPMAYITGRKEFYEHEFIVTRDTLVPRPETELLVELALETAGPKPALFLDAGCGSGNIGLSLLAIRPSWRGILMDISEAALAAARQNALNIAPRAILLAGSMFSLPLPDESLDLLVSNPPYIGWHERGEVMKDALDFEPYSALFSAEQGFSHLKALGREGARCLKPGGSLIVEHGASQREGLLQIYKSFGFRELSVFDDLAGLPRCLLAVK